jgi:hypothetical protein
MIDVEKLLEICRSVVYLRSQGWQKRGEMHEAISQLGEFIGVGAHPTGGEPNEFSHPDPDNDVCPTIEEMIESCDHRDDYGSLFLDGRCMLCGTKE